MGASAAAAGLFAVSALLLLAPSGLGAHASAIVIKAPYTGSVSPSEGSSIYGCGQAATTPNWNFHVNTGMGHGGLSAKSSQCSSLFGSSGYSDSYATGGFEVGVLIHVPTNGFHHVGANLWSAWRGAGGAFDGSKTGSCASALTSASLTYVDYYNGVNWSSTVPVGGPVYNSSTYYYYSPESYAYGSCVVESLAYTYLTAWVQDTTNGSVTYPSSTFGTATSLLDEQTTTYNYTDWYCYNYTLWDFGTWANQSFNCYNGNSTTTTSSTNFVTGVSGTSTSFSDSGSTTATAWLNGTYMHSHKYVLFIDLYAEGYTYVSGWPHGSAVVSVNLASHGNGFALNWVQVS